MTTKSQIHKSLKMQLAAKGADIDHYADLLNDYMTLWETKNALAKDIKERGVVYKDVSSVGVQMYKNNPSVKELVMVNRQMLSLLKELKLSTDEVGGAEDDEL